MPVLPETWQRAGFGIYVHWPFCAAKCPYCDFNSHVSATISHEDWKRAYLSEIDRYAAETKGRVVRSIYFGGGTPSLMQPGVVGAVIDRIAQNWPLANDVEVTLEANPTSVEAGKFESFRTAGVNRVSVGVQALNDDDLRKLGRRHTAAEALRAVDLARTCFTRVNFDLIYARQDQRLADWRAELGSALALGPDHLSLYQLTIEDGTAFGDRFRAGKLTGLPDEDLGADMFALTQSMCESAGLPAYEVSNHAKPGFESAHNMIYWRGGDYLGIGPGAHGRITLQGNRFATETPLAPAQWLSAVAEKATGEASRGRLSHHDAAVELLMMGLRVRDGIEVGLVESAVNPNKVSDLASEGYLTLEDGRLSVTDKGRPLLNAILREIIRLD